MYSSVEREVAEFFSSSDRRVGLKCTRRWAGKMSSEKKDTLGGLISYSWPKGDLIFIVPGDLPSEEEGNLIHVTRSFGGDCKQDLFSFKPAPGGPGLAPGAVIYGHSLSWKKSSSSGPKIKISSSHVAKIMFVIETCDGNKMTGSIKSDSQELCGKFQLEATDGL